MSREMILILKIVVGSFMQEKDLYNAWRTFHPGEPGFTQYHKATKSLIIFSFLRVFITMLSKHLSSYRASTIFVLLILS